MSKRRSTITVELDPDLAAWVRAEAARQSSSVSQMIDGLLRREVRAEEEYASAMERYFQQSAYLLAVSGEARAERSSRHDRGADRGAGP
jgi:hypothetical protein